MLSVHTAEHLHCWQHLNLIILFLRYGFHLKCSIVAPLELLFLKIHSAKKMENLNHYQSNLVAGVYNLGIIRLYTASSFGKGKCFFFAFEQLLKRSIDPPFEEMKWFS